MNSQKEIRIFISSTFSDMNLEREQLIKKTFPALRAFCYSYGYSFIDIDLRWGITETAVSQGKVVPICLQEIDNCRPFFIGIIGDRYGSIIEDFHKRTITSFPWIEKYKERSITELEVIYGALSEYGKESNALFYFRDELFYHQLPSDIEKSIFYENTERGKHQLQRLKNKIQQSKFATKKYASCEHLGNQIYNDLKSILVNYFKLEKSKLNSPHELFASNNNKYYISRTKETQLLEKHLSSDKRVLILHGKEGVGKTSLLANWFLSKQQQFSNEQENHHDKQTFINKIFGKKRKEKTILSSHFIGADKASLSWTNLIINLISQVNESISSTFNYDTSPYLLKLLFNRWMVFLSKQQYQFLLIIDGLDQLEDEDQALDFNWLPKNIPANVKFVLSHSEGSNLNSLLSLYENRMELKEMNANQQNEIVANILIKYGKVLEPKLKQRILDSPRIGNPLFLKSLLEELRVFGNHEKLEQVINKFAKSNSNLELFSSILLRLQEDFDKDQKGLLSNILQIIYTCRHGVLEYELLEIAGSHNKSIPILKWSPIFLAIQSFLSKRDGLISIRHQDFRKAIEKLFLKNKDQYFQAHQKIINYFLGQENSDRKISELPWHLLAIHDYDGLKQLLTTPSFLSAAFKKHRYEIKYYWVELISVGNYSPIESYSDWLENPQNYLDIIWDIFQLIIELGFLHKLEKSVQVLQEHFKLKNDYNSLHKCYGLIGKIFFYQLDYNQALHYFQKQTQLKDEIDNPKLHATSITNVANIYRQLEDIPIAYELYQTAENIFIQENDLQGIINCKGNLAYLFIDQENINDAYQKLLDQYELAIVISDYSTMVKNLAAQAFILSTKNKFKKALQIIEQGEELAIQTGELENYFHLLTWKSRVFQEKADYDEAMNILEQQEKMANNYGNKKLIALNLDNQAFLYAFKLNQPTFALSYSEKALEIATQEKYEDLFPRFQKRVAIISTIS